MTNGHLKQGELEDLCWYLITSQYTIEKEDIELKEIFGEDVQDLIQSKHRADQSRATILEYQNRSSFGRTKEEIKANAALHVSSCYSCFLEYISDVHTRAFRMEDMLNSVLKRTGSKPVEFSLERFYKHLKNWDYIGILSSHIKL